MPSRTIESSLESLGSAVRDLQEEVRCATPGSVSGDQALRYADLFAQAERAAASGIALYTPRVEETGAHTKAGHGSAAAWLGSVSGSSPAAAKDRLATAKAASADAVLTEALHQGDLSSSQLKVMSGAEAAAPGSAQTLLDLADAGASHQELSDAATRLRAAARSKETERLRRERVHAQRHFRVHQRPEGGMAGSFFCDEVQWARVGPGLEADAKARWRAAGSKDGASLETYRLDAFIALMGGGGSSVHPGSDDASGEASGDDGDGSADGPNGGTGGSGGSGAPGSNRGSRVETLVVIDAESLRRGTTEGDELCEIEGIGPVSVGAATELLGEGALRYLIKEGFDIKTVTRASRTVAKAVDAALIVRDRTCCVPGCGKRLGLERDHVSVDYGDDGPTELDNLVRLCPNCHALKTFSGWRLEGKPGSFTWIAPAHPKSAGAISRTRKVATAKAKAGVTKDRNRPQQT